MIGSLKENKIVILIFLSAVVLFCIYAWLYFQTPEGIKSKCVDEALKKGSMDVYYEPCLREKGL